MWAYMKNVVNKQRRELLTALTAAAGSVLLSGPSAAAGQTPAENHPSREAVTGIGGDIYVRRLVFVINYGETVGAEDQTFDVFKRRLMFGGPCWKYSVTFLCGEGGENTCIFCEGW